MTIARASWDEYFLGLASAVGTRATCVRRQVGAVIILDRRIVATGYNGAPSGFPHCTDGACPRAESDTPSGQGYEQCIAVHAEANAIMFSSPEERGGATLFTTQHPCFGCAKLIANSGIVEVVAPYHATFDQAPQVRDYLLTAGVRVRLPR